MKLQKLYSYTRKAMDDFQMIKENDSIAVGISGGKTVLRCYMPWLVYADFIRCTTLLLP